MKFSIKIYADPEKVNLLRDFLEKKAGEDEQVADCLEMLKCAIRGDRDYFRFLINSWSLQKHKLPELLLYYVSYISIIVEGGEWFVEYLVSWKREVEEWEREEPYFDISLFVFLKQMLEGNPRERDYEESKKWRTIHFLSNPLMEFMHLISDRGGYSWLKEREPICLSCVSLE